MTPRPRTTPKPPPSAIRRYLPILDWLPRYERKLAGRRCRRRAVGLGAAGAAEPRVRLAGRRPGPVRALHGVRRPARVSRCSARPGTSSRARARPSAPSRPPSSRRSSGPRRWAPSKAVGYTAALALATAARLRRARPAAHGLGLDLPVQGGDGRLHPRLLDRDHHRPVRTSCSASTSTAAPTCRSSWGRSRRSPTRTPPRSPSAPARSCCCCSCATGCRSGRAR